MHSYDLLGGTSRSGLSRSVLAVVLTACLSLAATSDAWALDPGSPTAGALLDLNTASESALQALPGVGPATSKAIIAARPFASVDDLAKVKGIGPAKLAALRNVVTVGASKAPAATAPSAASPPPVVPRPPVMPVAPAAKPPTVVIPAPPSVPSPSGAAAAAVRAAPSTSKPAPTQKVNINTASLTELEALPGIGPSKAQKIIAGRPYGKPEDVMKVSGIKEGIFAKIKDWITVQ